MKSEMKRKGFTLVELLIVIVVIGILSAMMMLSSTEAVSSARANNIVSNLRNLKTAALAFYVDSFDVMDKTTIKNSDHFKFIKKHLNNEADSNFDGYSIEPGSPTTTEWYIKIAKSKIDSNVRQKLASRAASLGLLKSAKQNTSGTTDNKYEGTGDATDLYMFVR